MTMWWQDPFRMFQTNLREIDAGLDIEAVLDYLEDFGADTWLLSVGGILSNYPTDLDFQTRNPYLSERPSGDLVGDAVEAAARRGIRVLGRMDFSKIDHRRAEAHPDWCFVGPTGERQVYNGLTSVCPSGEYYQVKLFEVLDEVLDRYPLAGFFCNWMSFNEVDYSRVYHGVCHCVGCRQRYDGTLPDDPDAGWRAFTKHVLDDLTGRIREHLEGRAALVLGDRADIVFHEANNAVGRRLWHHRTSENVSAAKTYRPEVPVLTNSVAFVDMPYRLAGEDPRHFAQYLVQAIARGANPSTYIMGTPATTPYACLEIAGQLTRFHRDHADVYRDLVPAARTLLVRGESRAEFEGLYLALLQRHVPFDVLPAERLPDVDLGRYQVVVLPDLGPVDLGEYDGKVVATGVTELNPIASYETEAATRGLHLEGGVPVIGAFHVVEAAGELQAYSRAPYGPPEKCHGHELLPHPGMVRQGNKVLFPWTIGRAYREVGLTVHRDLFVDQVGEGLATELPEQVEVVVGRSAAGYVVHLLNRSGDTDQRFAPPLPIGPGRLRVPDGVQEVHALNAGERLPVDDGWVHVPEIGLFEVLVCA
ncbi:alpha-amylase family protein [Kribbella sp. GL6]|uniref:alpha-amylase family protein n=1 Tax=Kribbella sp. GL6 TaxID=3419765 RepID=UPI003D076135